MKVSPSDPTFVHEYGRYLQSQAEGPAYLFYTAIPNLLNRNGNDDATSHDANTRAFIYFNKYYGGLTHFAALTPYLFVFQLGRFPEVQF